MGARLRKNAVMTAYINSYCLVCDCSFDSPEETGIHIQQEEHMDKLLSHPYILKYGDNHIRKVNKGYFCEFCGLLLATAAKVSLHVQEKSHYFNKGTSLLRRPAGLSGVVAFDDVLITEKAWHSLSEDTCAICNEEFTNENIHKTESSHLLKLVQNKVEFGDENSIYRKIDETSFQCLTCNFVYALNELNDHFTKPEHKHLYAKCRENMKKISEQNQTTKESEKTIEPNKKNENEDLNKVDKNHNNISVKSEKQESVKANDNEGKESLPETSTSKSVPEDEATAYANANNLTYNAGNTNTFCRICETKLPATLRSMREHVDGKEHRNKLAKAEQVSLVAKAKPTITKRPAKKFIKVIQFIETAIHSDVIINRKYCMPMLYFEMLTLNGSRWRCLACEIDMSADNTHEHIALVHHERALEESSIITSLSNTEFVREIRPTSYHCGYCNLILPGWEELGSHLQKKKHIENREACAFRLRYHPTSSPDGGVGQELTKYETEVIRMFMAEHVYRR